jgi:hypothetical protein
MKIVGTPSEIEDIEEIEEIVKVFVIAQRIKNLQPVNKLKEPTKQTCLESQKPNKISNVQSENNLSLFSARGLI